MYDVTEDRSYAVLKHIGCQLDRQVEVRVGNGGIVMPSDETDPSKTLGGDINHAIKRSRRSTTNPWQRTARWQGAPGRTGTAGTYASIGRPEHGQGHEVPEEVAVAYPGAKIWHQGHGFWLLTESALLLGEGCPARIATAVCMRTESVRAWAFWAPSMSRPVPIGPRHTYLDGAICALDGTDDVWRFGDSLVSLLDLYTLWVFRHLHLERIGRWPGLQAGRDYFERIVEFSSDELCGCDAPKGRYKDCCAPRDSGRDSIAAFLTYHRFYGARRPPESLIGFVTKGEDPPAISDLLSIHSHDLERYCSRLALPIRRSLLSL